jgi:hypothetical protein
MLHSDGALPFAILQGVLSQNVVFLLLFILRVLLFLCWKQSYIVNFLPFLNNHSQQPKRLTFKVGPHRGARDEDNSNDQERGVRRRRRRST